MGWYKVDVVVAMKRWSTLENSTRTRVDEYEMLVSWQCEAYVIGARHAHVSLIR